MTEGKQCQITPKEERRGKTTCVDTKTKRKKKKKKKKKKKRE